MAKTLLGKLRPSAIGMLKLPRLPADLLEGYRALAELTGTVSDALDECRIAAVVPGSVLRPTEEAGAIVDGAVRDTDHSRSIGYPVWSSSVSPITGKRRIETMAVNKRVKIAGIAVNPGDLVIADEVGVCFVPFSRAAEVLEVAQRLARAEAERLRKLAAGIPLKEFAATQKK